MKQQAGKSGRSLAVLLATVATVMSGATIAKGDISFPDFQTSSGINRVREAIIVFDRLRLTPPWSFSLGAAWFSTKQYVKYGFETTFQFQFTDQGGEPDPINGSPGGDGIAFVIQNSAAGVGAIGVLANPGYDGIENSLAVEFDTWANNDNMADPNGNHVSVHTRGALPNSLHESYSIGRSTSIPNLKDGAVHGARISYAPGRMQIFVDNLTVPVLTLSVDLGPLTVDRGKAWVGFTAGTGSAYENHDILNWTLHSTPPPAIAKRWCLYQ